MHARIQAGPPDVNYKIQDFWGRNYKKLLLALKGLASDGSANKNTGFDSSRDTTQKKVAKALGRKSLRMSPGIRDRKVPPPLACPGSEVFSAPPSTAARTTHSGAVDSPPRRGTWPPNFRGPSLDSGKLLPLDAGGGCGGCCAKAGAVPAGPPRYFVSVGRYSGPFRSVHNKIAGGHMGPPLRKCRNLSGERRRGWSQTGPTVNGTRFETGG